jgi:mycothiol synthase
VDRDQATGRIEGGNDMTARENVATAKSAAHETHTQVPGLVLRPFDLEDDIAEFVDMVVETHLASGVDWLPTVDQFRNDTIHRANFDPALDIVVAEIDGRIVGGAETHLEVRDGIAVHQQEGWVRPAFRRRGIGRALLEHAEQRGRDVAADWPGDEPHAFNAWANDTETDAIGLLEASGYDRVRYGFMMVRSLSDPIADAPLPKGLEIRPVREEDHRRIWDADCEAFLDHWGSYQRTEEDRESWFGTPELDTTLWKVAWAGDEVAGSVMSFIFDEENERLGVRRGWLEHISVRRPWRRRGVASALIVESLHVLRERGMEEAALGVDAENLSGALRLYESHGFHRHRTGIAFRKHF